MSTIKKGTYRFNDVLTDEYTSTFQIPFHFSISATLPTGDIGTCYFDMIQLSENMWYRVEGADFDLSLIQLSIGSVLTVYHTAYGGWNINFGDALQTITVPKDTEVSDEFNTWFTANTKSANATITYNGSTIASLFGGQTATLKCAETKMLSDIVVEVAEQTESEGGGTEFNIAYGDTEPTDTSKLWVKTSEPSAVSVASKMVAADEEIETISTILPTAARSISSAVVGTKVYLFGGFDDGNLETINVFDTATNTITTLSATLPTATGGIASAVVGTKVYLFGGYGDGGYSKPVNVFDTETNTITTLGTTLPTAALGIASAVVGTKVYLFGGSYISGRLQTINVFDTTTNTITTLGTTLPTTAGSISSAVVGTKVYLFGGNDNGYLQTINMFDTETNTITTLGATLPTAAGEMASAVIGTKVYLFGGRNSSGLFETINEFILCFALATNNLLIEATVDKNTFNLLPSVELGVKDVYIGNTEGNAEKVAAALYKDGVWTEI